MEAVSEDEVIDVVLLAEGQTEHVELLGETFGYAIIDSGCTRTVCGRPWLNTYLETLSRCDQLLVEKHQDNCNFRFGDGKVVVSKELIVIPVQFGSQQAKLMICVVDCDVPLLLSRESLKRANAEIDFKQDKVVILGEQINVMISSSGHLCIPILCNSSTSKQRVKQVLFSSPLQSDDNQANQRKIIKLHKQFAHPSADRLKQLIRNSGVIDPEIDSIVDRVSADCDICKRYRKPPPRPVVGFPLASEFNQVVAMDIKFISGTPVLHMIDHATRYSMASRVRNKKPETIIDCVLNHWIRIFGPPQYFLTDNGGEFINDTLLELCEKFNIELKTTAAESAWSNGLCERHNAVIGDNVSKIMADCKCSMDIAIPWAVCAKNSLSSVYGFSPNQLVFGRNINLPNVSTDKLSAQNTTCVNANIAKHLLTLHKARQTFTAQESCEKLRRALNKQTRSFSDIVYQNGDLVYYKRNNSVEWHGPAKVLGREASQYLLKHGGSYIRVHPCKMQLVDVERQCVDRQCVDSSSTKVSKVTQNSVCTQYDLNESDSDSEVYCRSPEQSAPPTPPQTPAQAPQGSPVDVRHIGSPADVDPIQLDIEHQSDTEGNSELDDRQSNDPDIAPDEQKEKRIKISRALSRLGDYNKPPIKHTDDIPSDTTDTSAVVCGSTEDLVVVKCPDDLPKPSSRISFRQDGQEEWTHGEVISRAGKRTTSNWHYMNIVPADEDSARCVSLKNAEWKSHPPDCEGNPEETYFGTSADSSRFRGAKEEEITKWREFKTFTEVEDLGQPRVSSRWVCTEKMKGGKLVTKARLVARGFEEDKSQLRTDSPTCTKESLRMLLSILSAKKWGLHSIDIKSAYLQGELISRDLYLQPPKEAETDLLWKLQKTPYGLVDAGRKWYIRVQKEFSHLGAKQGKCDRAVFIWENPTGNGPCGILVAHVDDFLYGGNSYFLNTILPKIRSTFHIGTEEEHRFKYLGLRIGPGPHGGIQLNLEDYSKGISEMDTSLLDFDRQKPLSSTDTFEA